MDFNKIVKILGNKRGKIFFKEEIYELFDPEKKAEYKDKVNKSIYRLRAQGVIVSIKAGVYIIPDEEDLRMNSVDLMEKYYFKLIKKIITKEVSNNYYISGVQSLQYHLKNYEIPDRIYVINRSIQKKVCIGKKEIIFKTISGNKYDGKNKKINLYNIFSKYTQSKEIDGVIIRCSQLELSLLESSLVSDTEQGIEIGLLTKAIKKYSTVFSKELLYEVGKYKYIMSFNRLKEISKTIDPQFSELCLDIIKKNGGLFIGSGNRGI